LLPNVLIPDTVLGKKKFPKKVIGDQNMEGKDHISLSSFQVHKVIQIVS
jgi:hypothetical protein